VQLTVIATDNRLVNQKMATALVVVNIERDNADPRFSAPLYLANTLREDAGTGASVATVTASDADLRVRI
jgi:hypothetical protein